MTGLEQQKGTSRLSGKVRVEIDHWLTKFPADQKSSAVLAALHAVQHEQGWVSTEMMDAVAEYLEMPRVAVYEVTSFYSMIETSPVGRNTVSICTNISCMLCGADDIVAH
ncbi:MAG: NAD(P)H-dependent oxidoreductase subunit E, partial [Gammaproteobacteria bacterium]